MKVKSVLINGIEDVSIIEEEVDCTNFSDDECIIETEYSLISPGTELSRVYGLKKGAKYPSRPGYCSVGKVLQVGKNLSVHEGDRVLFSAPHGSMHKFNPEKSDGGILFPLSPETDSKDAPFLEMCWIAMNGILPVEVKLTDRVAIVGMGTLGLVCAIYYKHMGVDVTVIEPVLKRADIARKMGICSVIDCAIEDQYQQAMLASNNQGYDIVVDASGLSSCIELCCKIAATYGQVVLMGSPRTDYIANLTDTFSAIHMKMLTVIGALNRRYSYSSQPGTRLSMEKSLRTIEKYINQKIIDPSLFISHIIEADEQELLEAYRGLMYDKEKYTGVLINWKKEGK